MKQVWSRSAFRLLVAALCVLPAAAEIIDRIAISVGNRVITVQQIDEEVRLTNFLNFEKLDLSDAAKKQAADRLIEQALVRRDMEFSPYPLPSGTDAGESLRGVKAHFGTDAAYRQALEEYGITEEDLTRRLLWQLTLVSFTDYRFRPAIQISDADLKAYYQQQAAKLKQPGVQPIPSFEDSRDKIEEVLTGERIEQAIDRWIADTRKQVPIRYHGEESK